MAKGDSGRSQNQIDYQGGKAQATLDNTNAAVGRNQNLLNDNYQAASKQQMGDYSDIMNNYKTTQAGIAGAYQPGLDAATSLAQGRTGGIGLDNSNVDAAITGFKGFADTGGFSGSDLSDIRARAISPTRSIYSTAQANLARQNGLSGGYTPNAVAGQARMARDESQQISDADIGANANIAQMVQQGKLYGLTGMSNAALQQQANAIQAGSANNSARLGGIQALNSGLSGMFGNELGATNGMTSLYGTRPGLMGLTQEGMLGGQEQQLQGSDQQIRLGLGLINGQNQKGQIPGDFSQGVGNIGSGLGLVGNLANMVGGLGGGSNNSNGGSNDSSGTTPSPGGYYPGNPNYPTDPNNPISGDPNFNYPNPPTAPEPGGPGSGLGPTTPVPPYTPGTPGDPNYQPDPNTGQTRYGVANPMIYKPQQRYPGLGY